MNIEDVLKGHGIGGGGGSNIKSVQRGDVNMTYSASKDITINAVDINKSIVKISVKNVNQISPSKLCVMAKLTSSTVLNLSRYETDAGANTVSWEVIEFQNVKSIQKGEIIYTGSSVSTVIINTVKTDKSVIFASGKSRSTTTLYPNEMTFSYKITNNTTIDLYLYYFDAMYWYVVEFN